MRHHSDPTANQALGTINREWNQLARLAKKIRENPNTEWAQRQSLRFTGIYKSLLTEPENHTGREAS